jgi:DNA-binding LacI/PurR family transcriptional regulator/AraC-like DNA-binding protein
MGDAGTKRLGLLLASIHTGSAPNVWSSFAREAAAEDMPLFIFPGGKLNSLTDLEYLRNPIYSLANSRNLDGLISWSSTMGYTISPEEFKVFHRAFESLPYVTIAHKIEGHPCVWFDAYNGMKDLVTHFIHGGAQRIAFLRGPDAHVSAIDRFNGYCDALTAAGKTYDERLVTDPAGWASGAAACAQLFETRGMVPGKDFDTLIGSSDMMTLPAIQYLYKHGYSAPADYRVGGFNNSTESRILSHPFSTVRMPYAELSGESVRIIKRLLERVHGPSREIKDVVLPCKVIIRGSPFPDSALVRGKETRIISEPLYKALTAGDKRRFFELFRQSFFDFLDSDKDIDLFLEIIPDIRSAAAEFMGPGELNALESELFRIIARTQEHSYAYFQYQRERWHSALNSLKCELLGARDRESLVQSLARHLPKIGIFTAGVMLYEDEDLTKCVGNFSPSGIITGENRLFPAEQMFPAELGEQYAKGIFMVQPLFIENRSLGYFIHNVPFYDGVILEELRSTVSNALKGIFLFEETDRAKQIAEQAERAKTEFFASIGNNLYDPFAEIIDSIEQIEKHGELSITPNLLPPEEGGSGRFREQIGLLKSAAVRRQAKINHLIDLSLSQIDNLSFNKSLFTITEVLPELESLGPFPLLSGDRSRLSDAFSLIREVYGKEVTAQMVHRGLKINFGIGGGEAAASLPASPESSPGRTKHTMLLAERIILVHNGEFVREDSACSVVLPWITFTGQPPLRNPRGKNSYILSLSELPFDAEALFGFPVIRNVEKAISISGRIAFIVWNADETKAKDDGPETYAKAAALRSTPDFFNTPFLCFSRTLSGETLSAAVDALVHTQRNRTVLFIGLDADLFPSWIDRDMAVQISSPVEFTNAVANAAPSLIALGSIDFETIEEIHRHPATAMTPIIVLPEYIKSAGDLSNLCRYPRVVLCNRSVANSGEFSRRVRAIAAGDRILPIYTGALVKKVLLYFNQHAESHISRWKLADSVNVSEDYLTRIFRREMGFSLWEYLNQYRVHLAAELLMHTGETISEIAMRTGFQDQTYFCRVFKKIYGMAPGQLRSTQ